MKQDSRRVCERAARRLKRAGIFCGHGLADPFAEAVFLLAAAARCAPADLPARVDEKTVAAFESLVAQRAQERRPAAYLVGYAWFEGRRYLSDERALVPRSFLGEFIRDHFYPWLAGPRAVRHALDLGTGGGSLALTLAHAFPRARVDAVDLSPEALALAAANIRRHRLGRRVNLISSSLFGRVARRDYDLVVANPPYATEAEYRALPAEFRHEPKLGLVAPGRGLALILEILRDAKEFLAPAGLLAVETGNRAPALARLLPRLPLVWLTHSTGDESVFLVSAEQLRQHHDEIAAAAATTASRKATR